MSPLARIAAALVALIAWVGLGTQLMASLALAGGALPEALWAMLFYFTVLTNLLVAIGFTAIAFGRPLPAFWLGGLVLSIALVGVIYNTLLVGLIELSGGALLADFLNHTLTPILVPIWWLIFAPKRHLRWRDPLLWALYPIAYFAYGLARTPAMGRPLSVHGCGQTRLGPGGDQRATDRGGVRRGRLGDCGCGSGDGAAR